jgi:Cu-Zn family superoxide dismutase
MQLSGPESVIGKALVVHADQDDFESQPSGNSGARIGCGEITETAGM